MTAVTGEKSDGQNQLPGQSLKISWKVSCSGYEKGALQER